MKFGGILNPASIAVDAKKTKKRKNQGVWAQRRAKKNRAREKKERGGKKRGL